MAKQPLPDFYSRDTASRRSSPECHAYLLVFTKQISPGRNWKTRNRKLSCRLPSASPPHYHRPVMPVATDTSSFTYVPVKAPRGNQLSCKGWGQEAAMRMLMNNLDPEVAERPQDLVVYGGTGRAARSWECYHAIVNSLKSLENDETLLVQSGKPVGIFRTHDICSTRAYLQLEPGGPLVELGEIQRTGEARPHHVWTDDCRLVDLHRHSGNHPRHIRDLLGRGRNISARDIVWF